MRPLPSPDSLWAATAPPAKEHPSLESDETVDVCVVGGGFTGASAALHLAESGAAVALLEADQPGWGASGRSGGFVIPGLKIEPDEMLRRFGPERGERLAEVSGRAPELVFELVARHGIDCLAERCGWILAAHCEKAFDRVKRIAEQWSRRGAPVETIGRDRTARLLGSALYSGGLLDRRGGKLQPLAYARGLARAAEHSGASIYGGSPATAVIRDGGKWAIETPRARVRADQVLLCTNAYSDLVGGLEPRLARSIMPAYSYQVATAPLPARLRDTILPEGHVVSDTKRLLTYFRLDQTGRLALGGRGRLRESNDPKDYRHVVRALHRPYPQLAEQPVEFYWGGRIAVTTDHIPHLHELGPGFFAGLGFNGRGIAMASLLGKLLAERAKGVTALEIPLPFQRVRALPLHFLRSPATQVAISWKRLLDWTEIAR